MTIDYKSLCVGDVMSTSLIYVDINATVAEAEHLMNQHNVHHLPVMENGCLESIISKRDIRHLQMPGHKYDKDEQLQVADICPMRAYVADINDPLARVVDRMAGERISAVIVLKDGELSGIFTEADACRVLAEILGPANGP